MDMLNQPGAESAPEGARRRLPLHFTGRRVDLYTAIHKALRCALCECLVRVGQLDVASIDATVSTLLELQSILDLSVLHLRRENELVHAALEARLPAASRYISQEHAEHRLIIETLREQAGQLMRVPLDERPARAVGLYRQLALFLAEQFQHMHVEETRISQVLWEHYNDDELRQIERHITAGVSPAEGLTISRWMAQALSPSDRVASVDALSSTLPSSTCDGQESPARTEALCSRSLRSV
jgi:hypothetical protein